MWGAPDRSFHARDEYLLLDPQAAAEATERLDAMVTAVACSKAGEDLPEDFLVDLALTIIDHLAEHCLADDPVLHDEVWSLLFKGHDAHTVVAQAMRNLDLLPNPTFPRQDTL